MKKLLNLRKNLKINQKAFFAEISCQFALKNRKITIDVLRLLASVLLF